MSESTRVASIRRRLLAFFDERARDLPWRRTDDPYAIWVSEVMLQQTRVETVVPYYERWMRRYPTVDDLADADQEEVLKAWEGLGYYRRARLLHRAAGIVRDRHSGSLPEDAESLAELPGVGPYTAGAVASIAFGEPVPAVDGNVRRVLSRLFDLELPGEAELRDRAAVLVDPERPGDFNQALMELGATVCTPRSPDCGACPLADACRAYALGVQEERPLPDGRRSLPERVFGVVVRIVEDPNGARCLLRRRPEDEMLGGLWEFPTREVENIEEAEEVGPGAEALPEVVHVYSHFRGRYLPFLVRETGTDTTRPPSDQERPARWVPLDGFGGLPIPGAHRKIADAARAALGA